MADKALVVIASGLQGFILIMFLIFGEKLYTWHVNDFPLVKFMFTHLMIFVGFGLLYAFLRRYSWTGLGQNFIIGVFAVEFYLLFSMLWYFIFEDYLTFTDFEISFSGYQLFTADFCAGAVLVSFGALIGKVNFSQMIIMAVFESFFYSLNEYLLIVKLETIDTGGSLTLHAFGAYFGLFASLIYHPKKGRKSELNSTNYASNIYAVIGTLILWVSWPCFNAAVAFDAEYTAAVTTFLSLLGSTVAVFIVTAGLNNGKFNMVSVANATIAGGVGIGSVAGTLEYPAYSVLFGIIVGVVSCLGFEYLSRAIEKATKLHDTAGINNLHGMPGILGSLFSIIYFGITNDYPVPPQIYGLFTTLAIAAASGTVFVFFLKLTKKMVPDYYVDEVYWIDCHSETNDIEKPLTGGETKGDYVAHPGFGVKAEFAVNSDQV